MGRSTQYIGLNNKAEKVVRNFKILPSDLKTHGMFGEEIVLAKWEDQGTIFREIVQTTPWSSGPMIFTCLEAEYPDGRRRKLHEWESVDSEFEFISFDSGQFHV